MDIFFKNPGTKIKKMAIVWFVFCVVIAVICGIALMTRGGGFVVLGFVIMPPIAFFFYVPILFLYAIGELVEKTTKTEENTRNNQAFNETNTQHTAPKFASVNSSLDESIINFSIGLEEDRVEAIASANPIIAGRLAVIQEMLENEVITKVQYFEELRKIQ